MNYFVNYFDVFLKLLPLEKGQNVVLLKKFYWLKTFEEQAFKFDAFGLQQQLHYNPNTSPHKLVHIKLVLIVTYLVNDI